MTRSIVSSIGLVQLCRCGVRGVRQGKYQLTEEIDRKMVNHGGLLEINKDVLQISLRFDLYEEC